MIPSFLKLQQPRRPILHCLHSYNTIWEELARSQTPHFQHAVHSAVCGVRMWFGGVCCTFKESSASPPLRRSQYLNSYNNIMTARWRDTTAWREPRRCWRNTTPSRDLQGRLLKTSGAVTHVLATRWCDMLPTDYYPLSLSLLGLEVACPSTRSQTCLPATTTMLSSWSWTASLRRPTSSLQQNRWQLRTSLPFFSSMWFELTVFLTLW